ncbi:MAG TPA: PHP domain-containing protein [Candidatus Dormibacteraeota bacterium]
MRVDLHLHTSASFDCTEPPAKVARRCRSLGLDPVFVTDHDSIEGALELQRAGDVRVVVGEEILTADGELIGLFLSAPVPAGLSASETAGRIHDQGGIVYLQHPFDTRRRALTEDAMEAIAEAVDAVEVFNGRSPAEANRRAQELRDTLGVPAGAGSDAHQVGEIGRAFVEMSPFDGPQDFLAKLDEARIVVGRPRWRLRLQGLVTR